MPRAGAVAQPGHRLLELAQPVAALLDLAGQLAKLGLERIDPGGEVGHRARRRNAGLASGGLRPVDLGGDLGAAATPDEAGRMNVNPGTEHDPPTREKLDEPEVLFWEGDFTDDLEEVGKPIAGIPELIEEVRRLNGWDCEPQRLE